MCPHSLDAEGWGCGVRVEKVKEEGWSEGPWRQKAGRKNISDTDSQIGRTKYEYLGRV